jgi:hypothetical protein
MLGLLLVLLSLAAVLTQAQGASDTHHSAPFAAPPVLPAPPQQKPQQKPHILFILSGAKQRAAAWPLLMLHASHHGSLGG